MLDLRSVNIADDELRSTGLNLGERGTTPYLLYRVEEGTLALLWFETDALYDLVRASAGTDIDLTGSDRNALQLPESSGTSVSGNVYGGLAADNEFLIAFSDDDSDTYVEFFRYVPSEAQGGLSAADRAKLDGVETGATADQTGGEIKAAYEGEADTNAFTDTLLAKLNAIPADATAVTIAQVLAQIMAGTGININRATAGQITLTATGGGGTDDGVVESAMFDETTQIVTLTTSLGGTVTVNLGAFITASELAAAAAEVKTAYEANPDTNPFTDARAAKLQGIASGANQLIPYKLGNIYRASAAGVVPARPGNDEGTATISGITDAPDNWQLGRPEPTAALPDVYDCHVYGYVTNGVFGVQYGTPNRTDRYIAPGGTGIDAATANDLIQAALAASVTGNTETGIAVTHNPDGTFDFVVAGGGGLPVVMDDLYFGLSAG